MGGGGELMGRGIFIGGRRMVVGQGAQSTQSTKLFLQSSELRLPHPLNRRRVCRGDCAPLWIRGGGEGTLACGRAGGGSQFHRGDIHCGTLGIYVLVYLVVKGILGKDWQNRNLRGKGTSLDKGY